MLNIKSTELSNSLTRHYKDGTDVILYAHNLIGTVRGKSANGLLMNSKLFKVVAIVDKNACGKNTSEICKGVNIDIPIYNNVNNAIEKHEACAIIFLIPPENKWYREIEYSIGCGLDLINTSFYFIKNDPYIMQLITKYNTRFFDLRDNSNQQAYPSPNILNRKSKIVYVTGTDCGIGKRTAAYELTLIAKKQGINAVMYATGQTGLMLGEKGTIVDSLISEFSNGVISQQVNQLCELGYELIFVEGQADIFHPANSAVAIALLHGSNPDGIVIVHDESRKQHKGFEEDSPLYMRPTLKKYIDTLEMLSLPCGPNYKTIAIATIGNKNIFDIKNMNNIGNLEVADVKKPEGALKILNSITNYLDIYTIEKAEESIP